MQNKIAFDSYSIFSSKVLEHVIETLFPINLQTTSKKRKTHLQPDDSPHNHLRTGWCKEKNDLEPENFTRQNGNSTMVTET